MKDILEALSVPLLLESIFYPFIALHHEIDAISLNRHQTRSAIKISIMCVTSIIGIYLFYNNPAVNQFFFKITAAFNLSMESQPLAAASLAILASCHTGSYLSNVIVKSFCNFAFGDPDFYVTKNRAIKLEQLFIEQGNNKITQQHIYEVVEFCRKNLRRQTCNTLGTKPKDWEHTLESLLYNADLEHFLDQQQALKAKQLELQTKLEAIVAYSNGYSNLNTQRNSILSQQEGLTPSNKSREKRKSRGSITLPISNQPTPITITTNLQKTPPGSTENTPLLFAQRNSVCYFDFEHNIEIEKFAKQELKKFKEYHLKKEKHYIHLSDECLLHHFKHHLQTIGLKTEKAIYPEALTLRLSLLPEYQHSDTGESSPTSPLIKSPKTTPCTSKPMFS